MELTKKQWQKLTSKAINLVRGYSIVLAVFDINNRKPQLATGTFISTSRGPVLVTAGHVIKEFLELGERGRLQIGPNRYTLRNIPIDNISLGFTIDLASILMKPSQVKEIGGKILSWKTIATENVLEGMLVAFVGYPGCWKIKRSETELSIGVYEFIGLVETVESDQFSLRIDDRYEIEILERRMGFTLDGSTEVGGLSGAPVFNIQSEFSLVGWIYEGNAFSQTEHKFYALHINVLNDDGTVNDRNKRV